MTGLWDAKVDRAPVLALTGQVDIQVLGPGRLPEGRPPPPPSRPVAALEPDRPARAAGHAELTALACKHAPLRHDVAHLGLPQPGSDAARARGAGRGARRARRTEGRSRRRRRRSCARWSCSPTPSARSSSPATGALHTDADDRVRRAARRAGDHHVQGQGPDRRRPPAGRRRARPQRHAGGELAHERGRPARGARRVVLQPHRHLRRASRSSRSTSTRCSWASSTRSTCRCGARSASLGALAGRRSAPRRRPTSAPRWPSAGRWARREGQPRGRRPRPRRQSAAVFAALTRRRPRTR